MNRLIRRPRTGGSDERSCGILVAILIAVMTVNQVTACDFCVQAPRVPFALDDLAAINVAIATQAAVAQGLLDLNPTLRLAAEADHRRVVHVASMTSRQLVHEWMRTAPARNHRSLRSRVELAFIDVDEACWLDVRLGVVSPGDSSNGPADVRLLTTRAGFCRVIELGLASCEHQELVAVEADDSSQRDAMLLLFACRFQAGSLAREQIPVRADVARPAGLIVLGKIP